MNRIDETVIGEAPRERGDGQADLIEAVTEALAAMASDEHEGDSRPVRAQYRRQVLVDA